MQHVRTAALAALLSIVLSACGGGGDASAPAPPPTPVVVPATVTVTAPARAETSEPTKFTSSAASTTGLQHKWDFGDGATSNEAAPSHSYAKAGDYEVVLKVSDSAGGSREVRSQLSVRAMANVAGLVCNGENQSGWCWQQPRPSGNVTNDLVFVTPTVWWRVGEAGSILKTTDGGRNWVHQRSGTDANLQEAYFVDDKRGAVLGGGVLLTTRDGGANWTLGKPPVGARPGLRLLPGDAMYLPGSDTAYVSTDDGNNWTAVPNATAQSETGVFWYVNDSTRQVSRSTDGGRTVTRVYDFSADLPTGSSTRMTTQLVARGDRTAALLTRVHKMEWAYDERVDKEVIHVTVDGGATWRRMDAATDVVGFGTELIAVSADAKSIWTDHRYSGGWLRFSRDGGATWEWFTVSSEIAPSRLVVAADGVTIIGMDGTRYWLTEDFGKTWTAITAPASGFMSTLKRVGADMLVVGGTTGQGGWTVSVDKGRTWQQISREPYDSATARSYRSPVFIDAKTGLALDGAGKLLATTDGGQTWADRRSDLPVGGGSLHVVDAQTVVFSGMDGRLMRSKDRGINWVADASNAMFSKIEFGKAGLGWGIDTSANLVATQDGGLTWARVTRPVMSLLDDVYQLDANSWVAVGYDDTWGADGKRWHREAIAYTRDGGRSWTAATYDPSLAYGKDNMGNPVGLELISVTAIDAKTVFAVDTGGRILRSDDGGAQWNKMAHPGEPGFYYLEDIAFADAQRGWAVGNNGVIVATTDGGKTWTRQPTGTRNYLNRIHVVDGQTLWVSGGALLATATGGVR